MAYEDALVIEDSNHGDIDDKNLAGLPVDRVEDRVSRLHLNSASNTQTIVDDKRPVVKESLNVPGVEEGDDNGRIKPNVKPETRKPRDENAMCSPPATKFTRDPLKYSKFKAAFKVEGDKKEVYDATEKLKFPLDAVEGSAKSCLAKFMPSSDKYMEAWIALDERFGRVDNIASAAKRRIDQFPVTMKENSEQTKQYQEMVSELVGVYKEHNFVHESNSQIPEANVAKLPFHLCGRWAAFVEAKNRNGLPGSLLRIG